MTDHQWEELLGVLSGEVLEPMPAGFIIDSPWLPAGRGSPRLDYFLIEQLWLEANLKASANSRM